MSLKKFHHNYGQKLLHHAKQFARDSFKAILKRVIQKTAEATKDLIRKKIADKIRRG